MLCCRDDSATIDMTFDNSITNRYNNISIRENDNRIR